MPKKVNAIVLRVAGTNCDLETGFALKCAGAELVDLIHINRIIKGEVKLDKYHVMAIPGGFSYGDDVAAGKIFTTQLKYKLWEKISGFNLSGKLIIGICNGFQVLVKLGFLPGTGTGKGTGAGPGEERGYFTQTATLTNNDSNRFECRWVFLKREGGEGNLWTRGMPDIIQLPVAHGEGKFMMENESMIGKLEKDGQVAFKYSDKKGSLDIKYPDNPNGAQHNIAGISNKQGNILGLMPHPERFVMKYQHPAWTRHKSSKPEEGDGLQIFRNAVAFAQENLV